MSAPRTSGTCRRRETRAGECFVYEDQTIDPGSAIYVAGKGNPRPSDLPTKPHAGYRWLWCPDQTVGVNVDKIVRLIPHYNSKGADAPKKQISDFPHRCPNKKCAAPAYIGFMSVTCSKGCSP